jgi:hypothetical protein
MNRYCMTKRPAYAIAFGVALILSVYAKQLSVFTCPLYAFQYVRAFGIRRLFSKRPLMFMTVVALCLLPLVPMTLKFSQFNVGFITNIKVENRFRGSRLLRFVRGLWAQQFHVTVPLLLLGGLSLVGAAVRRDSRILLFLAWVASVYLGLIVVGAINDRFFCYWLPAFAAMGAASYQLGRSRQWQAAALCAMMLLAAYQVSVNARELEARKRGGVRLAGAAGYEAAAEYVTRNPRGQTILYSALIDTGYFTFFVRKHDPQREMIVLRADKILTTSRMRLVEYARQVNRPEEILPILQRYGVGYVVLEDRPYPDGPLEWLRQLVGTPAFAVRKRIPIESVDNRVSGSSVSVYEYLDKRPADLNTALSLNIPLMNDSIDVRLGDLIKRTASDGDGATVVQ